MKHVPFLAIVIMLVACGQSDWGSSEYKHPFTGREGYIVATPREAAEAWAKINTPNADDFDGVFFSVIGSGMGVNFYVNTTRLTAEGTKGRMYFRIDEGDVVSLSATCAGGGAWFTDPGGGRPVFKRMLAGKQVSVGVEVGVQATGNPGWMSVFSLDGFASASKSIRDY